MLYRNAKPATEGDDVLYLDGATPKRGIVRNLTTQTTNGVSVGIGRIGPNEFPLTDMVPHADGLAALEAPIVTAP